MDASFKKTRAPWNPVSAAPACVPLPACGERVPKAGEGTSGARESSGSDMHRVRFFQCMSHSTGGDAGTQTDSIGSSPDLMPGTAQARSATRSAQSRKQTQADAVGKYGYQKAMQSLRLVVLASLLTLSACGTLPADTSPSASSVSQMAPEQRLAAVVAASAGADDRELAVQPLRDPEVQDLREDAVAAIAAHDYATAAEALNQALLIAPDDPAILQERAEVALLQAENERAETLARRAFDLGSKVGPLCRRHWATIEQACLARGLRQDAASAHAQIEACTVAGLNRM